jgi:hypothetical protein
MKTITQMETSVREDSGGKIATHWIGGRRLNSGERLESINPATGEVIRRLRGGWAQGCQDRRERGAAGIYGNRLEREPFAACPRAQRDGGKG